MRTGSYRYGLVRAGHFRSVSQAPFSIQVVETLDGRDPATDGMRQHLIEVTDQDGTMQPDQAELTVLAGDLVMWHSRDAARLPFAVVGEKEFFDSQRLVNECGFSHAFAVAGEYHWQDAFGSELQGVVRVSDPSNGERDLRAWQKRLSQGTLVMIKDGTADPAEIDIVTGQTVYFAVVTGPGISVTDSRILAGRNERR